MNNKAFARKVYGMWIAHLPSGRILTAWTFDRLLEKGHACAYQGRWHF